MIKFLNNITICFIGILFFYCSNKNTKTIESEIILQIDSLQRTKYEYIKYLNRNRKRNADINKSNDGLKQEFLNKSYFIADAYQKKYDTTILIKKTVENTTKWMCSRYKGYLWNENEEPKLLISDKQIIDGYKKTNRIFDISYIKFLDSIDAYQNYSYAVNELNNNSSFERKINKKNVLIVTHLKIAWPFLQFYEINDELYKLKERYISKVLKTSKGFYIFKVNNIDIRKLKPFNKNISREIKQKLRKTKELKLIASKQNEVILQTGLKLHTENFPSYIQKRGSNFPGNCQNVVLMEYKLNNKKISFTIQNLEERNQYTLMVPVIKNEDQLREQLKNIVIDDYLFELAKRQNIINRDEFILDKNNFQNNLLYEYYLDNEIKLRVKLNEEQIKSYYSKNIENFCVAETAIVSIFEFKDEQGADMSLNCFYNFNGSIHNTTKEIKKMDALINYKLEDTIHWGNSLIDSTLIKNAFNTKTNTFGGPFECNSKYYLIFKHDELGNRFSTLQEVRGNIESKLKADLFKSFKQQRLDTLKQVQKVIINKLHDKL